MGCTRLQDAIKEIDILQKGQAIGFERTTAGEMLTKVENLQPLSNSVAAISMMRCFGLQNPATKTTNSKDAGS